MNMSFQYSLNKKNHFKYLLKGQLKTISLFLAIFTFCYFAINMEAFLYVFPKNVKVVIITYFLFLLVIFIIMYLIGFIYSLIMTSLYKKNNSYRIYNYQVSKDKIIEKESNFEINFSDINKLKIKDKYIKIISLKNKQIIDFEKKNFIKVEEFDKLKEILLKRKLK